MCQSYLSSREGTTDESRKRKSSADWIQVRLASSCCNHLKFPPFPGQTAQVSLVFRHNTNLIILCHVITLEWQLNYVTANN